MINNVLTNTKGVELKFSILHNINYRTKKTCKYFAIKMLQQNLHIPFNVGLIDSLRVRVKMDRLKILDKRIITRYIAYYHDLQALDNDYDGEYFGDEYKNPEPYTKIINGITYRFYPKAYITPRKTAEEYMVFQISAKMLKSKYFEGITKHNIQDIVNDINSFNVVRVSLQEFLQGFISDIDICINQLIALKPLKIAFGLIQNFALPGKKPLINMFFQHQNEKTLNVGLEFNKREKASNTTPYCKIYHKGFELQTKSKDFYNNYLVPMKASVIDNLVRYEFTIKASKHKKYLHSKGFSSEFKTLEDLLNTSQKELTKIAKSGIANYLEKKPKNKINPNDFTPMDLMISFYIQELINLGFDEERLLGFQYLMEDKPVQKSLCKTKAKKIIAYMKNKDKVIKEKIEKNEQANEFLRVLGLGNFLQ